VKYIKRTLLGILAFTFLYLGTVWVWASSAAPELLKQISCNSSGLALKPQYKAALIKIEDPTFYEHSGLDVSNGQGLTTLTSGLAKVVFLGDYQLAGIKGRLQSFYRVVFDCCKKIDVGRDIMALVLDSKVAKQDQLNMFLNSAYLGTAYGKMIIGFEAAATAYYGKKLVDLSENEFNGLVAMLIAPNYYHPLNNPKVHAERVKRIKAVIKGQCEPEGWRDLTYEHCATDT